MRPPRIYAATAVALLAVGAGAVRSTHAATPACPPRVASSAYSSFVGRAVAANTDLWGTKLLSQRGGPTYESARGLLAPLTRGVQWGGTLTASGAYYLPLSFPFTPYGSTVFALHVSDGSQIITRRYNGPSLTIDVGNGDEVYGSCAARLPQAKLAEGYLPILQTTYTDAGGARYRQESFVGRAYGKKYGARSVISFVRLDVDATHAKRDAIVRVVPWKLLAHSAPDRLADEGQARLIVSTGAQFAHGVARYRVPRGKSTTIYLDWLNAPSNAEYVHAGAAAYETARATVVSFWQQKLASGATFDVPEPAVQNAENGILAQLIAYAWRYSIGNEYEELSYAESLDAAEVAAEYGFAPVAKNILEFSLQRMRTRPWRFTAFRGAHILSTAALYFRLTHDTSFLHSATPQLAHLVDRIGSRQQKSGQLLPEALSTDLEGQSVNSVSGQIEAITGLRAIAHVWSANGYPVFGAKARSLAASIDGGLRPALAHNEAHLADGSLFVPDQIPQKPFARVTATRDGSYWNLVMPYAFESGWFPAGSPAAKGILRYLQNHGSRFLGMPRTYARTVYGTAAAGVAQVYELGFSRFLADNGEPDQLVLSLYGMLAGGMTSTYVSGEAVSLTPVDGRYDRTMFMPPNSGANASYLDTLRQLLIHERRDTLGTPTGLDLAFATPRAWLRDGKEIQVQNAPTSFGAVSYTLQRSGTAIDGTLVVPAHAHARLRLRLPAGERLGHVVLGSVPMRPDADGTIDLGSRHGTIALHATVT
jgi:hypothetical protein